MVFADPVARKVYERCRAGMISPGVWEAVVAAELMRREDCVLAWTTPKGGDERLLEDRE